MFRFLVFMALLYLVLVHLPGCARVPGVDEYQSCMSCGYKFGGTNGTPHR